MNVTVIHEVWTDTVGAQLGLQWCRYPFPEAPRHHPACCQGLRADSEGHDGWVVRHQRERRRRIPDDAGRIETSGACD